MEFHLQKDIDCYKWATNKLKKEPFSFQIDNKASKNTLYIEVVMKLMNGYGNQQ